MDLSLIRDNFLNPPILFFFLGMLASAVRSDLEFPQPLPKLFSLYLLLAVGFQGGVKLSESGFSAEIAITLLAAIAMAFIVPIYAYFILRWKIDSANAAAIAATYGSISAVTFITAASLLHKLGEPYGGHLVAAMALMESPAIIIGVWLYRHSAHKETNGALPKGELLRDAFFNGSVVMILGSLVIGLLTGKAGEAKLQPFTGAIFTGMLSFFLLDMGLVAAKRLRDLKRSGAFLIVFALVLPLFNAALGIVIAKLLGISAGDALLFTVLCASASYIAVPAAMRLAIPAASPSLYVPMSLAITFPFNIVAGLPLYLYVIQLWWR